MIRRTTNAPTRSRAPRRVCVPLGVEPSSPRGRMERITERPDGQDDVPAEEAAPRQGARLPRPDEDDPGSSRSGRQAGPRAEAPDGLTQGRGPNPPRLEMLSRPQDFAAIQERGTSRS